MFSSRRIFRDASMTIMKRRRWIQLSSAVFGAALLGCRERVSDSRRVTVATMREEEWTAFGTRVGMQLAVPAGVDGDALIARCKERVREIDAAFSLWEPKSEIRQLNDKGVLHKPSDDMLNVLELSDRLHKMTEGAFDPTVQPLWDLYESHFSNHPAADKGPPESELQKSLALVGWERVLVDPSNVRLDKGMALTLNGVVQGYATEEVAKVLRANGVSSALVNTGEFQAVGAQPDGSAWNVAVSRAGDEVDQVDLVDRALAVSSGASTAFDLRERFHHLFHPRGDAFASSQTVVAVEASGAGLADGLATACSVMDVETIERLKPNWGDVLVQRYYGNSHSDVE